MMMAAVKAAMIPSWREDGVALAYTQRKHQADSAMPVPTREFCESTKLALLIAGSFTATHTLVLSARANNNVYLAGNGRKKPENGRLIHGNTHAIIVLNCSSTKQGVP